MKKVFLMLAVLLLASAAYADVAITCTQTGAASLRECTVRYAATAASEKPRGMALRIDLNVGTITSVTKNTTNKYWVYPGSIDTNDPNPAPTYNGTPVAEGGVGYNYMIIEMGSLHSPTDYTDPNAPAQSGDVIKFTTSADCTVALSGNAQRGKIVKYDATAATDGYTGCVIQSECLKSSAPEYSVWVAQGRPTCWCYKRQCRGDADGLQQGPFWVASNDLTILRGAISKVTLPPGGICADFDHAAQGPFRVASNDLTILRSYISKVTVPCCDADTNCVLAAGDKLNFWTN